MSPNSPQASPPWVTSPEYLCMQVSSLAMTALCMLKAMRQRIAVLRGS